MNQMFCDPELRDTLVLRAKGGLGNQLFQYAAARAAAQKMGLRLKVDAESGFRYDQYQRQFRLTAFGIAVDIASTKEVNAARRRWGLRTVLARRIERLWLTHRRSSFCPLALRISVGRRGGYLEGYWQSEKYFEGIAHFIRKELTISTPRDAITVQYSAMAKACNSVAVHVRRVQFPYQCDLEYYEAAMSLLRQKIKGNLTAFVFSDDPKDILTKDSSAFFGSIQVPTSACDDDVQHLRVFSSCRHHILANSTFGWWGAWLSDCENQVVVAPRRGWDGSNRVIDDAVPSAWCTL